MVKPRSLRASSVFLSIAGLAAGAALAQTNLETNAGIQFNFATPGAANLAMGGAFLALADDATAAYTNPAGLTQIFYRELHLETRGFEYTHVYTDSGGLFDPESLPANFDPDAFTPNFDLLTNGEATDRAVGLSFLSYVHRHERWSWALYRHELARFEANFLTTGARVFPTRSRSPLGIPGERDGRLASLRNSMDLVIVNHGASAACRVHPRLSLGAGLSYYDFSIDSTAERRVPQLNVDDPVDISRSPVVNVQSQIGDDSDWGFTLGFLWEAPERKWRVGGVYRDGPSFQFAALSQRGPEAPSPFRSPRTEVSSTYPASTASASPSCRATPYALPSTTTASSTAT
ncbi:MAG TPA: hypothetical protein VGC93_18245 [Thermoanaerobaculia bacterium]|jgi:long-subunit fatty acid transport protein